MIKRFITQTHNLHNDDSAAHINACGNTFPFISIAQIDADYSEIFCDMTNLPLDLADASAKVKRFFDAYSEFFLLPGFVTASYSDNALPYPTCFPVRQEHAELLAAQLFDYICALKDDLKDL